MISTTFWVELVPGQWPDWRTTPYSMKVGKVLRRRPTRADRPRFVEVKIEVPQNHFSPAVAVTL